MDKATKWLIEQYNNPAAAYTSAEWARMAGQPTQRITRWFVRRKLIIRSKVKKEGHHVVTRDDVQRVWPDFWRSVRRRLADLVEKAS